MQTVWRSRSHSLIIQTVWRSKSHSLIIQTVWRSRSRPHSLFMQTRWRSKSHQSIHKSSVDFSVIICSRKLRSQVWISKPWSLRVQTAVSTQCDCKAHCVHARAVSRFKNPNRFFTGFLSSNRFFKPVFFSSSVITKRCLRSAKILAFYAMHVHIYVCVFKCISDQAAVN